MTWKVEIKPNAEKQYIKLDAGMRKRIKGALIELERLENPLLGHDVRPLTGRLKGDYRARVGKWRILFTPDREEQIIRVYAIIPRSDAY